MEKNFNRKKIKQSGFTLVELAIVLVIIGLLIGGILVAQSMINTQKVQAFCRQVAQFDAAVATFRDKFKSVPGDSYIYNSAVGNGNGYIQTSAATAWDGESANFWFQLSQNGFKNDELPGVDYSITYAANFPINAAAPSSPKGKTGNNIGFIAYGATTIPALDLTYPGNVYIAADCTLSADDDDISCTNGFSGPDSASIDAKIDDGNGTSGNIVAVTVTGGPPPSFSSWASFIGAAEVAHDTSITTSNAHTLVIRMGSQTGELY